MNTFIDTVTRALDPDRALQTAMASCIEATGVRHALDINTERWEPGKPLKLLLAGYVGTRNTGADVRVEEMIRQFRTIFTDENLELTIMTSDHDLSAGYFRTVRQVRMPQVFPQFLLDECPKHHGVVACEGSMFKSKFASALTTMMAGALGMAAVEGKLSVGYGAEAGDMTDSLQKFVRKYCKHSLVICRNEPSRGVLGDLGVRTTSGADTAWTFEPAEPARGAELLRKAGWDGEQKVLIVCPINPFWWPVKPDLLKSMARRFGGQYKKEHYKSIYFHNHSDEVDRKLEAYIDGLAGAVNAFCRDRSVMTVLVGMEKLDRGACELLQSRLKVPAPLFISDEYDMYDLVSVLRNASMLVSSRFHAIVTSMPGLVPSAGVTMDERIRNLMNDRNHPGLFLEVDDENLSEKLLAIIRRLDSDGDAIADQIGRSIPKQLRLMGKMGIDLVDEVARIYPDFPVRNVPREPEQFLPPLSPKLQQLMERYSAE